MATIKVWSFIMQVSTVIPNHYFLNTDIQCPVPKGVGNQNDTPLIYQGKTYSKSFLAGWGMTVWGMRTGMTVT